LRRSKYVQSDLRYSYSKATNFLIEGRMVLFVRTPCQIAGLYKYLKISNITKELIEKLLIVYFICSSVCSPQIFEDWKEELE